MKKLFFIFPILLFLFSACTTWLFPPRLKFKYSGDYTGIDSIIFIDGYYQSLVELPQVYSFEIRYEAIMFYPNGLFCKTTSDNPAIIFNGKGGYKPYTWGNYIISGDTIKMQYINNYGFDGGIVVGNYNYLVKSFDEIVELPKNKEVSCGKIYKFHPLVDRIGYGNWLLKKKWFYKKER
jgi:hypothetical protein